MVSLSENTNPLNPLITLFAPLRILRAVYPSFSTELPLSYNCFLPAIESKNNSVYVSPGE